MRSPAGGPALLLGFLLLTACAAPGPASVPAVPTPAGAPPAQEVCLPVPELDAPPERIVTMDGGAAAFLARLGAGDRIVGTAAPDFIADFTGPLRQQLDAIPVLDPRQGNAEVVVGADPDLVVGISALSFGGFDGTPTVERLARAGAAGFAACESVGDGPVGDIEATFVFVEQLAGLVGVPERGAELVAELRAELDAAQAAAPAEPVRVLALSGAPAAGQPVRTQGGDSFTNGVVTLAGGTNIAADQPGGFVGLSAEEAVLRDPEVIVVISGIGRASPEEVRAAVRSSPVLAPTSAVREDRLVVVPQTQVLSPSLLNAQAVGLIARALASVGRS